MIKICSISNAFCHLSLSLSLSLSVSLFSSTSNSWNSFHKPALANLIELNWTGLNSETQICCPLLAPTYYWKCVIPQWSTTTGLHLCYTSPLHRLNNLYLFALSTHTETCICRGLPPPAYVSCKYVSHCPLQRSPPNKPLYLHIHTSEVVRWHTLSTLPVCARENVMSGVFIVTIHSLLKGNGRPKWQHYNCPTPMIY